MGFDRSKLHESDAEQVGADAAMSADVSQFASQVNGLNTAASNGDLAVSPEAFDAYMKVVHRWQAEFQEHEVNLKALADRGNAPKLGSAPFAKQVAEYHTVVAGGDDKSFLLNLQKMDAAFKTFEHALQTAKKNYAQTEDDNVSSLKSTNS